jgi:NAD(P)-dependent dehydrogenase (short-subunit alcohol dehydrogenase family)
MADNQFDNSGAPLHVGLNFTQRIHSKAEGPTDPTNVKLPKNFVAVITGAGKGLGFAIAVAYAKAGASGISISSRTQADLDALTKELKEVNSDVKVLANVCDTRKDGDVKRLAEDVEKTFSRVDVVVANAGIISAYIIDPATGHRQIPQGVVSDDDFERVIDINLTGSRRTAKYFVPLLAKTQDGAKAFVVITSMAAHSTDSALVSEAYILSKIACNRLAELIHNDHYEKEGVLAYAIHPGAVVTPQTVGHSNAKGDVWEQSEYPFSRVSRCDLTFEACADGSSSFGRYWAVWWFLDLADG